MGGLPAFLIAAPVKVICCAGGGVILAAILGGIGGWLTGLGGIAILLVAAFSVLNWRSVRCGQHTGDCNAAHSKLEETHGD